MSRSSTLKKRGFSFPCRQGARWPRPRHTAPFCGEGILGENLCSAFSHVKPILASIKQQTWPHPPLWHDCFGSIYFLSPTDPACGCANPSLNPKCPQSQMHRGPECWGQGRSWRRVNQARFLPSVGVFDATPMQLAYDGYGTLWPLGQTLQIPGAGGISPLNQGLPSTSCYQISSLTCCFSSSCCKTRSRRAKLALGSYPGAAGAGGMQKARGKGCCIFSPA